MDNILPTLLQSTFVLLGFKLVVLFILLFFALYCLILLIQLRALNRLIYISANNGSRVIIILAILYLLASISLFFLALVIL